MKEAGFMTADEFVAAVEDVIREGAIQSTLQNLAAPPGVRPNPHLLAMSRWYARLAPEDQHQVAGVIRLTAEHAVLDFLSVLDGASAIESPPNKGHLELYHVKGEHRVWLNDPNCEPLNDKLRP
jgi:hypothetical protein